jgi:predicted  nucleic acid-binding Zn-ribbon protein
MATDHHDELEGLRTRVAELEELVQQLGQQLDGLSEHLEYRFQRHYERMDHIDNDARERDRELEYQLDRVRSDAEAWARDASADRGW